MRARCPGLDHGLVDDVVKVVRGLDVHVPGDDDGGVLGGPGLQPPVPLAGEGLQLVLRGRGLGINDDNGIKMNVSAIDISCEKINSSPGSR